MAKDIKKVAVDSTATLKVKFIESPTGAPFSLAYNIGDEVEFSELFAKELIGLGIAVEVK